MTLQQMICIASLILLSGSVCTTTLAQEIVFPDSVVMLKDQSNNEIGFVIPRKIAIDYRNLLVNTLPAMEAQIRVQQELIGTDSLTIISYQEKIGLLEENIADGNARFATQKDLTDEFEKAYKHERRMKIFWQFASGTLAVASLAVLLLIK